MSKTIVEVLTIDAIDPHPNADRLEIATIRGAKTVVTKDKYQVGDKVVFFPPDLLVPENLGRQLGVSNYLKHAEFPGDIVKTPCRVAGARVRGQVSFGFVVPVGEVFFGEDANIPVGTDATAYFNAHKYEPPVKVSEGCRRKDHPAFPRYTDIDNYYRYPNAIPEGTPVRITEKIHGRNCRVGLVRGESGDWEFVAGSHNFPRKKPEEGAKPCIYWEPLEDKAVLDLLTGLCDEQHSVVAYGEIYGQGCQDLDYGVQQGQREFRVFDILFDGRYLDWADVRDVCKLHGVQTVPLLYEGPFTVAKMSELTDGPTTIRTPRAKFKGREGVVVTPLTETCSEVLGGRMILKSISADYLDRKGAEDNGEI